MSTANPRRTTAAGILLAAALMAPGSVRADVVPIDVIARGTNRINVDGVLGDWRHFTELVSVDDRAQVVSGESNWTGPDDASIAFALAQDDQFLYVGAEVHDDQVVRSRTHGANDDTVLVALAVPGPHNGFHAVEIAIQPGEPGSYAGSVRLRGGHEIHGAQIVEAPLRGGSGFSVEAAIPWAALGPVRAGLASVRGRVAYQDADHHAHPAAETVLASGPGDAHHAALLPVGSQSTAGASAPGGPPGDHLAEFRQSHELNGISPVFDRSVNIAGDAALEHVVVFGHYLFASGPGIAGGSRYAFVELPSTSRDDVLEVAERDINGDGLHEVIVRLRPPQEQGLARELLLVYGAPNGGDQISRLFAHELRRTVGANDVSNRATYEGGGRIRITYNNAAGFTAANYPRVMEPGVGQVMTPWGPNRVEIYRWNDAGQRFDLERAEPNPNATSVTSAAPAGPVAPGAPPSPTMAQVPDAGAVLALFRRQRGIAPDARANFTANVNVAGDATPETVQVFGRYLVVTGPAFMNGRSFYNLELPVTDDSAVLGLQMGDVTGDGRAEALIRVRRSSPAQVRGQTLSVDREYLLVYSFDDAHRGRVFGAELSRRVGTDAIENRVANPGAGSNSELAIEAAPARGWTQDSYPFNDAPTPGFAPIVLPWAAHRRVLYRWNGTQLAPTN